MCFPSLSFLAALLPYVLLFLMPIYGSFFGTEPVLRFSILLYIQNILARLFSRFTVFAEPLIQFSLLLLFFSIPSSTLPYPLVWLYDKSLRVSEPVWQLAEAVGMVRLSVCISKELTDRIWDQPVLAKSVILVVSSLCHLLGGLLAWTIFQGGSYYYKWALIILLVLMVAVHCMTFINETGVILDAAVVHMSSMVFLYAMYTDARSIDTGLKIPKEWQELGQDSTYLRMLSVITTSGVGGASHVLSFVHRLMDPWFLCSGGIRLCSIMYTITLLRQWISEQDESDEGYQPQLTQEEEGDEPHNLHWSSPLILRLVIIFVYTQFLVYHIQRPIYETESIVDWLLWLIPSFRWLQIIVLNGLYVYKLAYIDEDEV